MTLKPVKPGYGPITAANSPDSGSPSTEPRAVLDGGSAATQPPTGYDPRNIGPAARPPKTAEPDAIMRSATALSNFGDVPATKDVTHNPTRRITPDGSY